MAMFDRDMCYIAASRRFIMDYRLDVDHLVGRSHYEVFPEIPEHWRQIHRRCLDGAVESSDGEPFVRGDGSVDWVRWSIQPLRDAEGAIGGIIMFTEDISASKRVADALRLSEERLRLAVEATGLGSYDYDARKCSSVWSSQLYDLIGLPKSTRMTREQGLSVVHPEDRNRVARLFEEVLDLAGPGVFDLEYRVVRQDGAVRWWRDQGRAFFEGEGKTGRATRVVGTVQDITEQKQAEEALREANRLKDEFLATLAHELRNPLAPIQSGIDALHLRCADPQVGGRILGMMQRQISHLVRLVDDLLDVSRVTRGRITLRKEPVDVGEIIRRAVEISDAGADALQHRQFSIVVPPLKLVVEADPVRLVQVVANLLDNALKYTADGGRIGIAAALEDGQARIAIEDDGVGMAPDTMDQMFEMFAQADPGRGSGLGIGLTLARELVQLHGGTIEGRSQGPGQGSQFIVRLPLTRDPGREPEPPAGGALAPPVRDRVLVVDDNPDVAEALGVLLEVLGTDVRAVHDGAAALDIFDKFRPRIVFLDLGMPNLDGYEVARRIRARDSSGQVILVALTGWSQEGVRQRVEAAGFDHYLIKPTKIETLQQILVGAPRADRRGHHP
jgi:PAS domain S-box-containing protein